MSREEILTKLQVLDALPVAFQALWDGDTTGWFIRFSAVTQDGQTHPLGGFSEGSDIRLFNGQVPPWPEALAAQQLGRELASRYGAEFYFPSPDYPEDDCPAWKDRDKGYPCRRCAIWLLQRRDCPWYGMCYHCHLDEERERREAQWTPEQRSGPRCHICGDPATSELNGGPVCAGCFDRYEVYNCEHCGCPCMISKSVPHSSVCRRCECQIAIDALTPHQRSIIRAAMAKGRLQGIQTAMDAMGCSLYDADYALHVLGDTEPAGDAP